MGSPSKGNRRGTCIRGARQPLAGMTSRDDVTRLGQIKLRRAAPAGRTANRNAPCTNLKGIPVRESRRPQKRVHTAKGGNHKLLLPPAVFLQQFPLRKATFSPSYEHSMTDAGRASSTLADAESLGGRLEGS